MMESNNLAYGQIGPSLQYEILHILENDSAISAKDAHM
jgi:hypothetical protein